MSFQLRLEFPLAFALVLANANPVVNRSQQRTDLVECVSVEFGSGRTVSSISEVDNQEHKSIVVRTSIVSFF